MRMEIKLSMLILIVFAIFVPLIPVSTIFPPPMVARNWHCAACPMMTSTTGYASISYVVTGSNFGLIDTSNYLYVGACLPLNVIRNPCLSIGMINPQF